MKSLLKYPYNLLRRRVQAIKTHSFVSQRIGPHSLLPGDFDYNLFKGEVTNFVHKLQTDNEGIRYRYSVNCSSPSLYASAYACMTLSLFDELTTLPESKKESWKTYFDSFQRADDGLFYDPVVSGKQFNDSDWWGARHLALHMISAYTDLRERPKYPFHFLQTYYDLEFLEQWLRKNEQNFYGEMDSDFDNKLMNITCLLQYQRDFWNDERAGKTVEFIEHYLLERINPETGLWGDANLNSPDRRSRKVQFAYHVLPIYFYDNKFTFDFEKIIPIVLGTQNKFGGFGVKLNSSACEDIDSIDILIRLAKYSGQNRKRIDDSLKRAFSWVFLNQVDDGGFVFRLNEQFVYGHHQMGADKNIGAIFPTWFRTLSIAYLCKYLNIQNGFKITRCPGYEF